MRDRIVGPDGEALVPARPGGVIGPDGLPVRAPRIAIYDDQLVHSTGYDDGMPTKQSATALLRKIARYQRDGASHEAIIAKFDLMGEARSPFMLNRALAVGRKLLDEAIAAGKEPAETPPGFFDDEGGVTAGPDDD